MNKDINDNETVSNDSAANENEQQDTSINLDNDTIDILDNKEVSDSTVDVSFTTDEVLKIVEEKQQLEKEVAQLKDDLLRGRAEMENMKKRLSKHHEESFKNTIKTLLLDIVELLDNFERALEASSTSSDGQDNNSSIIEGIKMIETQFIQVLETKWKVSRFDSVDTDFDPNKHEAMLKEVNKDIEKSMVSMEFSKGYMFENQILRPAKVKVTVPE